VYKKNETRNSINSPNDRITDNDIVFYYIYLRVLFIISYKTARQSNNSCIIVTFFIHLIIAWYNINLNIDPTSAVRYGVGVPMSYISLNLDGWKIRVVDGIKILDFVSQTFLEFFASGVGHRVISRFMCVSR